MFNYSDLNDVEFEELCKDIMQKKLKQKLRTFSRGKDKGIDIKNADNSIIIQVKHYIKSTYTTLIDQLSKEQDNVEKLNPKQYYICVSKDLNPSQIEKIYKMFSKYMKDDNNVITIKEIDDFLQKSENEEILNKHFKLWLSATNVLDKIGRNDVFIDCESLLDNINEEVKYFVRTNMFDKCLEILDKERIIAIIGMPGVGKTITSKMLVLKYVEKGYSVRYTTNSDLSNIKKAISTNPDFKEIVLLDDCLGQHYLKMEEKQQNQIMSLISYIRMHTNKILIMNSRVTIFNEARNKSDEFDDFIEDDKVKVYTIDMNNIDIVEKAKIFYNHLYFNSIGKEYLDEIKYKKRYLEIIKHRNYNPRIISNISKRNKIPVDNKSYFKYIMSCLNNPKYIWKNEYKNRIEKEDRILLLVLYSISDSIVNMDLLEKAFNKRIEREMIDTSVNCFLTVLKRLNGSMTKQVVNNKKMFVTVLNPSVNDFLHEEFYNNQEEREKILDNAILFDQIDRIYNKNIIEKAEYIKNKIIDKTIFKLSYLDKNYTIYTTVLTYIVKFEIFDKEYDTIIEKGLMNFSYDTYYSFGDNVLYDKGTVVIRLLNSSLYKYYNIFEKLNNTNFFEDLISNIDLDNLIKIISIIDNKYIVELKQIPEKILEVIVSELNYAISLYLEDYDIYKLHIDIDQLFYEKREELENELENDIYETSEEEFDKELTEKVTYEVKEIVSREYENIINSLCKNLPKEIKHKIKLSCLYVNNDNNVQAYIKEAMEPKEVYNVDDIIKSNEDEMEIEIDNIFNRDYEELDEKNNVNT